MNQMSLNLESDAFNAYKHDFNIVLRNLLRTMEQKGADTGEVNAKMKVTLDHGSVPVYGDGDGTSRMAVTPKFQHKITSTMQIKNEASGELYGEFELIWDDEINDYVIRPMEAAQMNIFDTMDEKPEERTDNIIQLPGVAELPPKNEEEQEQVEDDFIEVEFKEIDED